MKTLLTWSAMFISAIVLRYLAILERGNSSLGGEVVAYLTLWIAIYFRKEIIQFIKGEIVNEC